MNQDQLRHAVLLREAFDEYLILMHEQPLQPSGNLLSYDFDFLRDHKWYGLAEAMIGCDLRELTNLMNGWNHSLCRWHAWSLVLDGRNEEDTWILQREFLDSLAHECLLMPSSIRDTLTSVATAAFHQVCLSIDQSHRDFLPGDPTTPKEKPKWLTRKQKEKRLAGVIEVWPESIQFLNALRKINTSDYAEATYNYRNLKSHAIGPRLGIGYTRTVIRSIEPATALKEVDNGFFVQVNVPGKVVVSYGYGGTPPIDLETARTANLAQYQNARSCYAEYRTLLEATVKEIAKVEHAA